MRRFLEIQMHHKFRNSHTKKKSLVIEELDGLIDLSKPEYNNEDGIQCENSQQIS
jgi:hypothetical protein